MVAYLAPQCCYNVDMMHFCLSKPQGTQAFLQDTQGKKSTSSKIWK